MLRGLEGTETWNIGTRDSEQGGKLWDKLDRINSIEKTQKRFVKDNSKRGLLILIVKTLLCILKLHFSGLKW